MEAPVADDRLVRAVHALDPHRVQVRVEHERRPAAGAAGDGDDARAPGLRLVDRDVEAVVGQPGGDEGGDLGLAGAPGDERGVHGVDRNEVGEQLLGGHGGDS
jgi:hypothetical protein